MKKKNLTIYYGLIMAIYSLGFVTMSAFSSVFLLDVGFSNGQVGTLLALGGLLAALLQPLTGSLIDKNPKVSTRKVVLLLSAAIVAIGLLIIFIPGKTLAINAVLYCLAILCLMLAQPFMNALGMEALNSGYSLNFGVSRAMGSLGYAMGSYVFGIITVAVGPKSIPIAFAIALFVLSLILFFYPNTGNSKESDIKESVKEEMSQEKTRVENPLLFLGRYKNFSVMLIGLVLIYFSHSLLNTFALQVLVPKGGNSESMGTASAIAAICELITTLLFVFYMKRIKLNLLLKISGVFFTVKTLLSLLVTSVNAFYLVQTLQMFGWGLLYTGVVFYVNFLVGEEDKAKGQAFAGMSYTVASVLATFFGGFIIDALGVDMMLIMGTVSSFIGTVILWITCKQVDTSGIA